LIIFKLFYFFYTFLFVIKDSIWPVRWKKKSNPYTYSDQTDFHIEKSVLIISSFSERDMGEYICSSSNYRSISEITLKLTNDYKIEVSSVTTKPIRWRKTTKNRQRRIYNNRRMRLRQLKFQKIKKNRFKQ
jgi:hypothetical protein